MMKMIMAATCALALTATGAMAEPKDKQAKRPQQPSQQSGVTIGGPGDQRLYGGNPDAGGGPRGNSQATNSPNASKELGSGP